MIDFFLLWVVLMFIYLIKNIDLLYNPPTDEELKDFNKKYRSEHTFDIDLWKK